MQTITKHQKEAVNSMCVRGSRLCRASRFTVDIYYKKISVGKKKSEKSSITEHIPCEMVSHANTNNDEGDDDRTHTENEHMKSPQ